MSTSIARIRQRPGRPARLLLPAWIVAGSVLVVATALGAPPPAEYVGRRAGSPGELQGLLAFLGVGAAVLLGAVRPWSYCRAWSRALVALLLWTPWTAFHVVTIFTEGGPASRAHVVWAGLTWIALLGAVVVSGTAVLRARTRTIPEPLRRAA